MSAGQEFHVFVVDDDEAVRDSLAVLIETRGMQARTFSSGQEFLDAFSPEWKGCLFLDVRMPGIDGLEVQRQLAARASSLNVVIMTAHGDVPMAVKAMKAGAVDFLEKPIEPHRLIETLRLYVNSKGAVAPVRQAPDLDAIHLRYAKLTAREKEVLAALVKGSPNKVIAFDLQISPRTVELHRAHVMEKMEASSLPHLVRMSMAIGVDPS